MSFEVLYATQDAVDIWQNALPQMGRVVCTEDRDFLKLSLAAGIEHAGIIRGEAEASTQLEIGSSTLRLVHAALRC